MGGIDANALMSRLGEEAKREEEGENNQAAQADEEEDEEARAEASKCIDITLKTNSLLLMPCREVSFQSENEGPL